MMSGMQRRLVPKLRFPGFQGVWQEKRLNELMAVKGIRNSKMVFGKEDVLSVSGEMGIVNQIEHLGRSYAGESVDNYHIVEVGDVVYTKSPLSANPYGIIKANKSKAGIVSTLYAVYVVNELNNFEFIDRYFELDSRTNRYLRPLVNKGAKNDMKISNERVLIDPVVVPGFAEQKKIAEFLAVIDEKLAALRKKRDRLVDYKRGAMQQLFTRAIRFKRNDGTDFPDWNKKLLGEVATFSKGKGVSKTETEIGGKTPCIRYAELYTHYGEIIDATLSTTSEEVSDLLLSEGGEVIIPASGESAEDIATCAYVARAGIAIGGDLNIVRTNELNGQFLARYLGGHKRMEIAKMAQGNSVVHLYGTQLSKIKIEVPHLDEQRKISDFLLALDVKINSVTNQLARTEVFKKGLLQQMFV